VSAHTPQPRPWRVEVEQPFEPELVDAKGDAVKGVKLWEDDAGYGSGSDLNDRPRANYKMMVAAVNVYEQLADAVSYLLPIAEAFKPTHIDMAAEHRRRLLDIQDLLLKARSR
jgi:hypothetical protein